MLRFHQVADTGVEITKYFSLSFGKVSKKFTWPALFLPVLDMQTDSNFQNCSLSFGKVSKIFTCSALFLPVPDRRTACHFHPWDRKNWKPHLSCLTQYTVYLKLMEFLLFQEKEFRHTGTVIFCFNTFKFSPLYRPGFWQLYPPPFHLIIVEYQNAMKLKYWGILSN